MAIRSGTANTDALPAAARWRRLLASAFDVLLGLSPGVVYFSLPMRVDMGMGFVLVLGLSSSIGVFLGLQAVMLWSRGNTLGMAFFGLEIAPRRLFRFVFLNGLLLALPCSYWLSERVRVLAWYIFDRLPPEPGPWEEVALAALVALGPNLIGVLLPGRRTLVERICGTRAVARTETLPSGPTARRRLPFFVDVVVFFIPMFPCSLVAYSWGSEDKDPLLPGLLAQSALVLVELWAWFTTRETIGMRAIHGRRANARPASHD